MKNVRQKTIGIFVLLPLVFFVNSCRQDNKTSTNDNIGYDTLKIFEPKKNPLIQKVQVNGIEYLMRYITAQEKLKGTAQEIKEDSALWNQKLKEYGKYKYFELRVSKPTIKTSDLESSSAEDIVNSRTEYLSFWAQQDFSMIQSQDTLPCQIYHVESSFGATPFYQIHLGFLQNEEGVGDIKIIFKDAELDPSYVSFSFPQTIIINENK